MPISNKMKGLLIGLHLLPGIVFSIILFSVGPLIQGTGLDLFLTQILLVSVFLLGLELLIAHFYCKTFEGKGLWSALRSSTAADLNWRSLALALVWAAASVGVMKAYLWIAGPAIERIRELPALSLPAWHFQNLDMPAYPAALQTILLVGMLASNVFAEEVYFRGFLLERIRFLGRPAFLVNGLLFIFYHFFQMRVAYPLIPFGILLSGYYILFRNVWGSMLIHLILNLAL